MLFSPVAILLIFPLLLITASNRSYAGIWDLVSPGAPVSVTNGNSSNQQIFQTSISSFASTNCNGAAVNGGTWGSGTFQIAPGTNTYYLNTSPGSSFSNLAILACPSGTTAHSINFENVLTLPDHFCSVGGCLQVQCSATRIVQSIISSTLSVTC